MKKADKLWQDFLSALNEFEDYNKAALVKVICDWLDTNSKYFSNEEFARYNVDEYLSIRNNLNEYPLEYTELGANDVARHLTYQKPTRRNELLMILSNNLNRLILIESDVSCPRCDSELQYKYLDFYTDELVIDCQYCGHFYDKNGKPSKARKVKIAKTSQLYK